MAVVSEGNPRWPLAIVLMVVGCALSAVVVWWIATPTGSLPRPDSGAGSESVVVPQVVTPDGPEPSGTPTPQECTTSVPLLVMTFNIHHAARRGVVDLEQVAREIEAVHPDVLALQEVDRNNARSAYVDEADWLGRRLGMTAVLGVNRIRGRSDRHGPSGYGNALLTTLPVLGHQNLRLPNLVGLERRGLLLTTLDLDGVRVVVGATHLQHRPLTPRVLQARYVARALAGEPGPRLLMGDLNDEPATLPLRILTRRLHDLWPAAGEGPGLTHPVHHPDRRIDFVLGDAGVRSLQAGVLVSRVSDHRAVWARAMLTGPVDCAVAH